MSKFIIFTIIGFTVLLIGLAFLPAGNEHPKLGTHYEDQGRDHLKADTEDHVPYNSNLPTSGPHAAQPADWGVYTAEVPDERLVHNMEHGGIVITYKPDLPISEAGKLKSIAETISMTDDGKSKKGFKVILAPRAKNTKMIQLGAWRYNFSINEVDRTEITKFYRDHLNDAPESRAA